MNVANMSLDELVTLQHDVKQGIEGLKSKVIAEIVEKMAIVGISVKELAKTQNRSPAKKAVYRNPLNPVETWCGIGKQPRWFKTYLENGGSMESMKIPI